jgi:hypothetical protein
MNEVDILAMTYEDIATILRLQDVENMETGITEQKYVAIHENVSCALSQGQQDGLKVLEGDMLNVAIDEYKLFARPEIIVERGDKVIVNQKYSKITFELYATKPFYYPSHCEVGLTGREPNG